MGTCNKHKYWTKISQFPHFLLLLFVSWIFFFALLDSHPYLKQFKNPSKKKKSVEGKKHETVCNIRAIGYFRFSISICFSLPFIRIAKFLYCSNHKMLPPEKKLNNCHVQAAKCIYFLLLYFVEIFFALYALYAVVVGYVFWHMSLHSTYANI